jgi:hypothetical protein
MEKGSFLQWQVLDAPAIQKAREVKILTLLLFTFTYCKKSS